MFLAIFKLFPHFLIISRFLGHFGGQKSPLHEGTSFKVKKSEFPIRHRKEGVSKSKHQIMDMTKIHIMN